MAWAGGLLALLAGLLLLGACTVDTPPTSEGRLSPRRRQRPDRPLQFPPMTPPLQPRPMVHLPLPPLPTRASATTAQPVPSDKPASPTVGPSPSAPSPPTATPRPTSPTATLAAPIGVPVPPRRDLYELARSLRHKSQEPIPYLRYQTPSDLQVGTVDTFKVLARVEPVEFHEISAKLEHVSDNAYWYVQEGIRFDADDLEEAAADFEDRVLPGLLASFGPMWSPDDLPGQRLTILHAPRPGPGRLLQFRRRISGAGAREQQSAKDDLHRPRGQSYRQSNPPLHPVTRTSARHQLESQRRSGYLG